MVQSDWQKASSGVLKEGARQHQLAVSHKRSKAPALPSGGAAWSYLNKIYLDNNDANTPFAPSMVFWDGKLCCMWADVGGTAYFAFGDNKKGSWAPRELLSPNSSAVHMTDGGALAVGGEVDQNLHAIIVNNQQMYHYRYTVQADAKNKNVWKWVGPFGLGEKTNHQPALIGFRGGLVCAFTRPDNNNQIYISRWTPPQPGDFVSPGTWSAATGMGAQSWGVIGMYIIDEALHLTYAANNLSRNLLDSVYDFDKQILSTGFGFQQTESSNFGCSVTSFDERAWLAFTRNNDNNGGVLVCELDKENRRWANNVAINQNAKDTPALTVLDDTVNCIFNAHYDKAGNLLLSQCPATTYPTDSWMAHISPDVLWPQLSIPGTHDTYAKIAIPFAQTQTMTLTEQLNAGLRYFDFRLKWSNPNNLYTAENLWFYHGPIWMAANLHAAVSEIDAWFDTNNSRANETIFVQISDEKDGGTSSDAFRSAVKSEIATSPRWVTSNKILPLGQLRGKVQLLRRYGETNFGINLTDWTNNVDPFFTKTNSDAVKYTVQDHWDIQTWSGWPGARDVKIGNMKDAFAQSQNSNKKDQIFLNFASAAPSWPTMTPELLAVGGSFDGVNETLRNYVQDLHPLIQRLGVVLMDFPEDPKADLVQSIIQTNRFGVSEAGLIKAKPSVYPFAKCY